MKIRNAHFGEGGMDGGAADLDSDSGVQDTNRSLEGLEAEVLVGEDAEEPGVDAQADPGVDVLLRGLEPRVSLCLTAMPAVSSNGDERQWKEWGDAPA